MRERIQQKFKKEKENMLREEDKETRKKKKKKVFTLLLVVDDENERCSERRNWVWKRVLERIRGKVEELRPNCLAAALRELEEEACIQALTRRSWPIPSFGSMSLKTTVAGSHL